MEAPKAGGEKQAAAEMPHMDGLGSHSLDDQPTATMERASAT